ncbi:BON domain-containing protein [Burkholderia gladioli]|uniref:BON domain-containing protein n=1 Tax=Burkholderia gladioli TaxID=28095 RepID=UPI00163E37B4|nr:BON domain-containing protein [Burkholderia gladioli]
MTTSDSSRRRRAGESSDPAAAGEPRRAADPSDPVACPDWWARPGALPTGASEIRHVPDAYRQAGMMRAAAEVRGGIAKPTGAALPPVSREHRLDADASIRDELDRQLSTGMLRVADDIAIDVRQACVTLDGTVPSQSMSEAIELAVARCGAVREIRNRLRVVPR